MKYFVKLIATEGEIQEGDYWMSPSGHFHLVSSKETVDKLNIKRKSEIRNTSWYHKGKFVLCGENENGSMIIGDIPLDLNWIKNGDEFKEEDLNIRYYQKDYPWKTFPIEDIIECLKTSQYRLRIKCPHCRFYH